MKPWTSMPRLVGATIMLGLGVVLAVRADDRDGDELVEKLMERTHEGRRSPYGQLREIVAGQAASWQAIEQTVQAFEPMCRALAASRNDEIKDSADGYLTAVKDLAAAAKRRDPAGIRAGFDALKQSCGDCHFKGGVGGELEEEHEGDEKGDRRRRRDD